MRDFRTFRKSAIRYWERRRLVYNLALVFPALVGYLPGSEYSVAIGDRSHLRLFEVGLLFGVAAIGANVCFSFCYALEFAFGTDDPGAAWLRYGRRVAVVAGIVFAIPLAFFGGRNISILQYSF